MKQKLLLFILPVILFTATLQAQIKVIDFGCHALTGYTNLVDETLFNSTCYNPAGTPGATGVYIQNTFKLGGVDPYNITYLQGSGTNDRIYTTNTGCAAYNNSPTSSSPALADTDPLKYGYWSPNGTGNTGRRQWQVTIPNGETVTFILASPGAPPTLSISDDAGSSWSSYTNPAFTTDTTYPFKISNSSGSEKTYIWYDGSGKVRLFRVYFGDVNDATLGLDSKISPVTTNVQGIGNRVYVSNVKISSEVNIYSITGALVKSFKTNNDVDFAFKSGLYIATIKTLEGQKSVKLLLN